MEKRILEIEKALQKCLKCNFYRWRLCGAYFDVEVPEWSEEDWYMASGEQREERLTMCLSHKCDQAYIDSASSDIQQYCLPDDLKAQRRFLAKCKIILSLIPDNKRFWDEYGWEISEAIYDLVAQLDFESLENGQDILPEILLVGLEYDRVTNLYPRYTEGLVNYYLQQIGNEEWNDVIDNEEEIKGGASNNKRYNALFTGAHSDMSYDEFNKLDLKEKFAFVNNKMASNLKKLIRLLSAESKEDYEDELRELETLISKTKNMSSALMGKSDEPELNFFKGEKQYLSYLQERELADTGMQVLDEYIYLYGDDKCSSYLGGVLARVGIMSPLINFLEQKDLQWVADNYNRDYQFPIMKRTDELRDLIVNEIGVRKNDSFNLEKYIFSLFRIIEKTAKVLFSCMPEDNNRAEINAFLRCLQKSQISDFELFRGLWLCCKDKATEILKGDVPEGITYMGLVEHLFMYNIKNHSDGNISHEGQNISVIALMYDLFIAIIESALLENGIKHDIFYYQENFGIRLTDGISDYLISATNGWPIKTVRTFASKLGHRITYSTQDKIESIEKYTFDKTIFGDIEDIDGQSNDFDSDVNAGKCKHAAKMLNTPIANKIYSALKRKGYTQEKPSGADMWVKSKELYAYFCCKITDVLVGSDHQIEIKLISQNFIQCEGHLPTLSRYASSYRRGKKGLPDGCDEINRIIEAGAKGQL